jgi:hypothetical protein
MRLPSKTAFKKWLSRQKNRHFYRGAADGCPLADFYKAKMLDGKNHICDASVGVRTVTIFGHKDARVELPLPEWAQKFVYAFDHESLPQPPTAKTALRCLT